MRLARAKVNLWLNVVGRRADGYHLLDSLVAFTDLADTLEVGPSDGLSLALQGPEAAGIAGQADNLVLKAARLLADRAGVSPRAALHLTKRIPVAAGLGGGSADAAATLRALVELWRVAMPEEELFDLAAELGADVPMCLAARAALASGVGEILRPAPPLPTCAILLVNPGTPLATPEVFAARRGAFSVVRPVPSSWPDLAALIAALSARGNDLTDAAISLSPAIAKVLDALRRTDGARYAAMSGSGATCFALYDAVEAAGRAATHLPAGWWRHAGLLVSG
ncbi:MAG: 4-(cytidine 5'-diphospho)-2-C-methyl-D-erythritol kinase [Reyranella sp.]|uniref:4-(cytidine 5'-diphospho)-2-C-methyl-D-erythritol kinase n=1 Tax=Reyranella sp. TaxID=1929291 RepID=UPI00273081CC|nr:4-(cytidine 5'-diphospho)-2-C-methyl-D-erythritol kinase [Reyranella sp.]MDP1964870.1 4-(cytidine 5'-diphospho)-2-C-methyl-D-erythritol kinase [Reyranella sp.]MDP2378081.1 4-(cytidine 5'-diphospho)-2-C-methyl-D-erythritol kinase [Reyranella sp.]